MDYSGYVDYGFNSIESPAPSYKMEVEYVLVLVVNVIIFLLGIFGNGVVIWIAGLKMKKSINTTWYLSLAVSDFMFCTCLPFNIAYMATSEWIFGLFMCKFTSFVMFLNMFSSIFLLVIISVDRCVAVMFPVWAQNHRTIGKASVVVILAWLISFALSIPSIIFRDIQTRMGKSHCLNDYMSDTYSHRSVAVSRFVFGFAIPFLIIILCYSIIILRLRTNRMTRSSKPFKIMTALIATFFICWIPYHIFVLMELNHAAYSAILDTGVQVTTTLASANSFLNPFLYAFMGKDFKKKFWSSFLSKIENAIDEEGRTTSKAISVSQSMHGQSTTV